MRYTAWLVFLPVVLSGCGVVGSSASPPAPTSQPTVTSVSITPTSANDSAGQTTQFSATVSGTGSFSQAVTWSVAGDGTIDNNGLFTAGSSSGTATVQVASVQDPMVINSASVTVSSPSAILGDFYGKMTSADGTQSVPLDFNLSITGNTLTADVLRPLSVWDDTVSGNAPNCSNLWLQGTPATDGNGNMTSPNRVLTNTHISLSGTQSGTGTNTGSVSLTWQANSLNPAGQQPISLSGQFSTDGSTLSGTYSNTGLLTGCFPSSTSGTFSFTKYRTVSDYSYSGSFTDGTAGQVPVTLTHGPDSLLTIGALPGVCASATSVALGNTSYVTNGRFFYMFSVDRSVASGGSTAPSSLALWGLTNDAAGQTIKIYATFPLGPAALESPCVENVVNNRLLDGVTLTKQ